MCTEHFLSWLNTHSIWTEIYEKLESCLDFVSVKYWLYVIPQLIARINDIRFSELLLQVLLKVSSTYPQALVCPISGNILINLGNYLFPWLDLLSCWPFNLLEVAVNTNDKEQKRIAKIILEDMRMKDTKLVGDARILSSELMRIAITPQVEEIVDIISNVSLIPLLILNRNFGMTD